jgi:hypothetical protein
LVADQEGRVVTDPFEFAMDAAGAEQLIAAAAAAERSLEEDMTALCGPRGRHDPLRSAVRHGSEDGAVTVGGRRVPVRPPRVRAANGAKEVPVPTNGVFSSTEILGRMAMERMLAKLSSRRCRVGLEPVGAQIEATGTSTSKTAVSRRFVAVTASTTSPSITAR